MNKTAIVYARVSDQKQAEADVSIPSQIDECRKKAEKLGATVIRTFVDEGRTGRNTDRPAFQDAIAFCEMNQPAYFICWSTSRFARNRFDAALYKRRLRAVGTEMQYISIAVDNETIGGKALEAFFEIMDELQSDQISADTKRSMLRNARAGFRNGGRPPYGFQVVPDEHEPKRKRLVADDLEAATVRRIFKMRIDGFGARTIAQQLNVEGVRNRTHRWNKGSIADLLRNQAVIGNIVFGKKDRVTGRRRDPANWIVVPAHQPIIDMETWSAVQLLMNDGINPAEHGSALSRFMFTGLLRCGRCGASMQTESAKGRSRRYHYYNCRTAQKLGGCDHRRIPAHEFDDWMIDVIAQRIFNPDNLREVLEQLYTACNDWQRDHMARRQALVKQLESTTNKNGKLYDILELHGKDAPNLGDLTKRLRENNAHQKRLEQELTLLDAETPPEIYVTQDDIEEMSEFLSEILKNGNAAKVRGFLGSFVKSITLNDDDLFVEYNPDLLLRSRQERLVPSEVVWLPETTSLGTVKRLVIELPARFRYAA